MTQRGAAVLALAAAALAAAWLLGTPALAPVGLGLVLSALGAQLSTLSARRRARATRVVAQDRAVEGGTVRIAYRLSGARWLGASGARARETVTGWGALETPLRRGRGELVLRGLPRGRHRVAEAAIVLEDPLGLARVAVAPPPPPPLLVYPRVVELRTLFSEAGRRGEAGGHVPLRRPGGFDLRSVRDYEPGEPLRHVHWPTTARRGRLTVRELEEAPHDDVVVVLDCDPRSVAGPRGDSSFDLQVRAAGSLVRAVAARRRRAALVLGSRVPRVVRVASLERDWEAALTALATVEPDGTPRLDRLLAGEGAPLRRARELMVVTARLEPRAGERLVAAAAGRLTAVVWVDAASFAARGAAMPPELARLAASGVALAVVRRGDDIRAALAGGLRGRLSA